MRYTIIVAVLVLANQSASGEEVSVSVIKGHKSLIYSVAFSPDGKTLVAGSEDKDGAPIKLWDVSTARLKGRLPEQTRFVLAVQFHPDGSKLASASGFDATVRLWDIAKEREHAALDAPFGEEGASATITGPDRVKTFRGQIKGVSFHPDGKVFATAGPGRLVRVWDLEAKKLLATLKGHPGPVNTVAFSPDGKTLASAGSSEKSVDAPGVLKLWEVATWREAGNLQGHKAAIASIAFSPKGTTIASGDAKREVRLWDLTRGQEVTAIQGNPKGLRAVAFSPDGKTIAAVGYEPTVRLVAVDHPKEIRQLKGHSSSVWTVAFSPDGKTLATAGHDETIRLWRLRD